MPISADVDPVTAWAEDVHAGRIIAGPHVRATAARHLRDLDEARARGLIFDREHARRVIDWWPKYLRLNGARFEGRPFHLHPSQAFRIGSLFGWKMEDGTRRFRRFYDEEGKGNGKSPMLAGIGIYCLVAERRARAEIYAAASKKDQAMVLFRDAVAMRELSPALSAKISALGRNPVYQLVYTGKRGDRRTFRPISSDEGQSGPRPYVALCDEVHEHRDRETVEMLERGIAKSPQDALLCMATNSGHDRKSFCFEQHLHAIKVAAGDVEDDRTFSFVCSLDPGDDWQNDPTCWGKANPLLGVTIQPEALGEAVAQARAIPGMQNAVARLHFCVWTEAHTIWLPRATVEACEDESLRAEDFAGRRAWVAVDVGATKDMTAKAVVCEDGQTADGKPRFAAFVHGYTPSDTLIERERRDQAPYSVWVRQGHLTATPGRMIGLDYVARDIVAETGRFDVDFIAYDDWMFSKLTEQLDVLGLSAPIVRHPQALNKSEKSPLFMPDSIIGLEELLFEKRLRIAVNPALRAAIASVAFYHGPSGLRRFDKDKSTARIDLAVALTMAVGAALSRQKLKTPLSPWEDPGFKMAS